MEETDYQTLRDCSSDLFKNSLVLPAAWTVARSTETDATVSASEIRRGLDGRVENNQIREALERLEKVGALRRLPHAGRPSPHVWVREAHPFWAFVEAWVATLLNEEARR